MTDERRDDTIPTDDQDAFFNPDELSITDPTTVRIMQLCEEVQRLRASGRHWRERALKAEPLAALVEPLTARAEDLQKRLNAKLADESAAQLANGHPGKPKVEAKP